MNFLDNLERLGSVARASHYFYTACELSRATRDYAKRGMVIGYYKTRIGSAIGFPYDGMPTRKISS